MNRQEIAEWLEKYKVEKYAINEGLTVKDCSDWKTLYSWFKNSKLSYRILFDVDKTKNSLRLKSNKSLVNRYFI